MAEGREWFYKIPFFSKYWLALTIALSFFTTFKFIHYTYFLLDFELFFYYFQIWRPITALFFYPILKGSLFHFIVNCYFLYSYSELLETGIYKNKPADYFCMLLFNWASLVVIGFIISFPFLMDPMVMSVVTVYSQLNKNSDVSSIFRFRNFYLPWALMLFHVVVHESFIMELIGILVGHASHFLLFKSAGKHAAPVPVSAPGFLKRWFPDAREPSDPDEAPAPRPPRAGHLWGGGRPLANNRPHMK